MYHWKKYGLQFCLHQKLIDTIEQLSYNNYFGMDIICLNLSYLLKIKFIFKSKGCAYNSKQVTM